MRERADANLRTEKPAMLDVLCFACHARARCWPSGARKILHLSRFSLTLDVISKEDDKGGKDGRSGLPPPFAFAPPLLGSSFVRSRSLIPSLPSFPSSVSCSVCSGVSGANALSRSRDDCKKEGRKEGRTRTVSSSRGFADFSVSSSPTCF